MSLKSRLVVYQMIILAAVGSVGFSSVGIHLLGDIPTLTFLSVVLMFVIAVALSVIGAIGLLVILDEEETDYDHQ